MVVRIVKNFPPDHPLFTSGILRHSQHWDPKSKAGKPAGQSDDDGQLSSEDGKGGETSSSRPRDNCS